MKVLEGFSYDVPDRGHYSGGPDLPGYSLAEVALKGPGLPKMNTSGPTRFQAEFNACEVLRLTGFRGQVDFDRGSQISTFRVTAQEVRPKGSRPKPRD